MWLLRSLLFGCMALVAVLVLASCGRHERDGDKPAPAGIQDGQMAATLLRRAGQCDESGNAACKEAAFHQALSLLWQPERHAARMSAYEYYLGLDGTVQHDRFMSAAQKMEQEAERCQEDECLAQAHVFMAQGFLREGNLEEALRESSLGVLHARQSGREELMVRSQLMHAEALARNHDKDTRIDALNVLLRTKLLAIEHDDNEALSHCYDALANFYAGIGGFDSAAAYKDRHIRLYVERGAVDSDVIQKLRVELAEPLLKGVNTSAGHRTLNDVVLYALRHRNTGLLNDALLYYRNYFLEQNDLPGVAQLYQRSYPSALQHVRDHGTLLRIKAYLFDAANREDSARHYYRLALASLRTADNKYQYAYLQLFHGRALRRWGYPQEAVTALQQGYQAMPAHQPFTIRLMAEIDSSFISMRQYDSAYAYHQRYEQARQAWDSSVNGEALLRQQIAAQLREHALAEERAQQLREQRHFTQYLAIVLGIVVLFIGLCIVGSLSVPKWVITATGFFAFVVLFEFIIMLADEAAVERVHGEPAFFLLCKIGIFLLLSPLHHKMEEKVLHYFYKHKLINTSDMRLKALAHSIRQRLTRRAPKEEKT